MGLVNFHKIGTMAHALTAAVQDLGVDTASQISSRSASGLYGRTCAVLVNLYERAARRGEPITLSAIDRREAVEAIDARIAGLMSLRQHLLSTAALPPLTLLAAAAA